ncbi:MAG: hypothetical protein WDN08_17930 [Rhizomicrobium sp.]
MAALGGGLMLACCTTMYVAPVGEDLAEATVINMASEPVSIFIYGDAKECTDRKVISPIVAPGERRTLGLAAKRYVAMTVIEAIGNRACFATFDFRPEAGGRYNIRFKQSGDACFVLVTDLHGGAQERPVHINKRVWTRPFVERSPSCERDSIDRSKAPDSTSTI